jgi:hypothetical protein
MRRAWIVGAGLLLASGCATSSVVANAPNPSSAAVSGMVDSSAPSGVAAPPTSSEPLVSPTFGVNSAPATAGGQTVAVGAAPRCLYSNAWLTKVDPAVAAAACTQPEWVDKAKELVQLYYPDPSIPAPQPPTGYTASQEQEMLSQPPALPSPGPDDGQIVAYPAPGAQPLAVVPTSKYQKTIGYYWVRVFAGSPISSAGAAVQANVHTGAVTLLATGTDGATTTAPYADGKTIAIPQAQGTVFLISASLPTVSVEDAADQLFTVNLATGSVTAAGAASALPSAATLPTPSPSSPHSGGPTLTVSPLSGPVGTAVTITVTDCPALASVAVDSGMAPLIFTDSAYYASHAGTSPTKIATTSTGAGRLSATWTIPTSASIGDGQFSVHCGDGSLSAQQTFAVEP